MRECILEISTMRRPGPSRAVELRKKEMILKFSIPVGSKEFFCSRERQGRPWGPPSPPVKWIPGACPWGWSGRGQKLTTTRSLPHHLVTSVRMVGAIRSLPRVLHACTAPTPNKIIYLHTRTVKRTSTLWLGPARLLCVYLRAHEISANSLGKKKICSLRHCS